MGISGTKPSLKKFETLNSRQKDVLKDLLKHLEIDLPSIKKEPLFKEGKSYLSSILSQDPEMMAQFEEPAMRQFQEEIVPGIAERFSGMGAQSSSAFNQTMGQQAGSLAERLAAMRANLGMGAAQMGLGYAEMPFQQALQQQGLTLGRTQLGLSTAPWGYQAFGGSPGVAQAAMGGIGSGLGQAAGFGIASLAGKLFGF
jgi:hypothetical protein